MTNDAIKEIRKAEENGAQLIINARAEARYRLEQTIKEIEKSKTDAEEKFKAILEDRITAAREQAQELISARLERAKEDAKAIEARARANMDKAVDIIIKEITALWQ